VSIRTPLRCLTTRYALNRSRRVLDNPFPEPWDSSCSQRMARVGCLTVSRGQRIEKQWEVRYTREAMRLTRLVVRCERTPDHILNPLEVNKRSDKKAQSMDQFERRLTLAGLPIRKTTVLHRLLIGSPREAPGSHPQGGKEDPGEIERSGMKRLDLESQSYPPA